jgi:hypothetical protein
MLKGRGDVLKVKSNIGASSSSTMVGTSDTALLEPPGEKAKKKLSFREPEIIGYYMQMKQGVANRLSKRIKSPRNGSAANKTTSTVGPQAKSCIFKNCASEDNDVNTNNIGGSTEDLNLEV